MTLDTTHPALSDLARRCKRRIPKFVWEYLDSAAGDEKAKVRNRAALDAVLLRPAILRGPQKPVLETNLMGRTYPLPFGMAPVGMSGLMWPHAEKTLARVAAETGIPYGLSCVATATPEEVGPYAGNQGWFQLYPPGDREIRLDLLRRAKDSGFHTLILTADVPVASRRERQRRSGLSHPPKMTPRILAQVALKPAWAMATWQNGNPRLKTLDVYADTSKARGSTEHVGYLLRTSPDWSYVKALREEWDGKLVVKGVLDPADAPKLVAEGVDALWVSNHAARQFEGTPASISVLPEIRAAAPDAEIIFDSGVEHGLDILRAFALGANFVMLGRAFHYGMGAFGIDGVRHAVHILKSDIEANMGQIGCERLSEVAARLV